MDFFGRLLVVGGTAIEFHIMRWWKEYVVLLIALISILFSIYALTIAPPTNFPVGKIEIVKRGDTVKDIATTLARDGVIAHPTVFTALIHFSGRGGSLQSGAYRFATPENALHIAWRLVTGNSEIPPVKVRFLEGATARQMSEQIAKTTLPITAGDFLAAAEPYEGYLFPDTYTFDPTLGAADVVKILRDTFDTRIASITPLIANSGHSLSDIVIMASLVEREARSLEEKRVVAGILWNRIVKGMPLQVDAVFGYIYGRATYSPSLEDLSVDSPYNTYQHRGLPPGPIDNPGLDSLTAAANPVKTDYLYYLTGRDGNMYYAKTFAEHKANRAKYLN